MNLNSQSDVKPPQTSKEWLDLFIEASKSGDFKEVQRLCTSQFKSISDLHARDELAFRFACMNGHLDIVKFLTTSKALLDSGHTFVDIHASNEEPFRMACSNGHLNIVKFLTTSQDLLDAGHTFVDIHANHEESFRMACRNGHLEIVKFLTTSDELLKAGHTFVDIHAQYEVGFQWALINGHLDIVIFLTRSKELLNAGHSLVNIHKKNEPMFRWACEYNQWNIIQFLIFDLKIERTPSIDTLIKKYPQTQPYFQAREEQEKLKECVQPIPNAQDPRTEDRSNPQHTITHFNPLRI